MSLRGLGNDTGLVTWWWWWLFQNCRETVSFGPMLLYSKIPLLNLLFSQLATGEGGPPWTRGTVVAIYLRHYFGRNSQVNWARAGRWWACGITHALFREHPGPQTPIQIFGLNCCKIKEIYKDEGKGRNYYQR